MPRRPVSRPVLAAGTALALLCLAAAPALAETVTGKLDKVADGGKAITMAGKSIVVSGARTNICIGGVCDQGRDKLKAGMTCSAEVVNHDGKTEARRLSCK